MKKRVWIMLYTVIFPYLFAFATCPICTCGGVIRNQLDLNRQPSRPYTSDISYSLFDYPAVNRKQSSQEALAEFGLYRYTPTAGVLRRLHKSRKKLYRFIRNNILMGLRRYPEGRRRDLSRQHIYTQLFLKFDLDENHVISLHEFSNLLKAIGVDDPKRKRHKRGKKFKRKKKKHYRG